MKEREKILMMMMDDDDDDDDEQKEGMVTIKHCIHCTIPPHFTSPPFTSLHHTMRGNVVASEEERGETCCCLFSLPPSLPPLDLSSF